jgi:restriction endonuclease S subunit
MRKDKIGNLLLKISRKQKIPQSEYALVGETPIIDQSSGTLIVVYTDNQDARHEAPLPITVFGDHTREVKYVNFPFASGADGTQLLYPNSDDLNPTYFYYAVKNVNLSNYFYARHSKFLKEKEINIPNPMIQSRIANILSMYDELIENNRRRMVLLEDSARQLYLEWFIHFRFPGHEHVKIKDGIPEGWSRNTLSDHCTDVRETVSPDKLEPDTPYIGLEHMPRRSISLSEWGKVEAVTSTKHRFRNGEILFGKIRPYFHKVGVAFIDGVASSDAIVIRPISEQLNNIVLMAMSSDSFIASTAQSMREGAKMPRADWKLMKQYPVPLPPKGLLETFNGYIQSIVDQLRTLTFQNQQLRAARDLLLPRLMNGDIAV